MSDNVTVFDVDYTGVTGIKCKGTGNGTLTYIRPQGTKSISANGTAIDVTAYASVDVSVSGGGNDFVVTLSYNDSTEMWEPDCTYVEVQAAYQAGKNIVIDLNGTAEDGTADGEWSTVDGRLHYVVHKWEDGVIYESGYTFGVGDNIYVDFTETYQTVDGVITLTNNDTTYDVSQYESAYVNVPSGSPTLQAKTRTISAAGTFTDTPDSGYDGLSSVTTTVPSADASAASMTAQYATESGQRKWALQYEAYAEEGGWVDEGPFGTRQEYKYNAVPANTTVTPTGSSQTIGGANYMMEGPVTVAAVPTGTAGTPTATKTIDHVETAALIVPSVTNSAGYISGGTITGTQFYVTVEELVAGNSATADSSGDWNVADLETLTIPSGTAGTPTATKSSVSNHSVSVTPSVSNSAGWISSGTKTGTAVSVAASELVSGTLSITSSGTKDVTNYASASVAAGGATASATKTVSNHSATVTPSVTRTAGYVTAGTASGTAVTVSASELVSGSETKTANGTYDVTNLASLVVAVPIVTYHTSSSAPTSSQGSDGDIWLVTS